MATSQQPSTAVAQRAQPTPPATSEAEGGEGNKTIARLRDYGALVPAAQSEYRRSQQIAGVADMLNLTAWGAALSRAGQVAMAKWCLARDVDPITELDNVGGPYINSEYFLRKLGELRVRGIARDVTQDHIAHDPRLASLAKDQDAPPEMREAAKKEHYRRMQLRIAHGAPEEATAVCVTSIFLAKGEPVVGVKWGGGGTSVKQPRSGGGSAPNPVVESNPTLSVESQSIRRAMRQLALAHPDMVPELVAMQDELKEIAPAPAKEERSLDHAQGRPEWGSQDLYTGEPAAESTGTINPAIKPQVDEEPDFSNAPSIDDLALPLGDARPAKGRNTDALRNG